MAPAAANPAHYSTATATTKWRGQRLECVPHYKAIVSHSKCSVKGESRDDNRARERSPSAGSYRLVVDCSSYSLHVKRQHDPPESRRETIIEIHTVTTTNKHQRLFSSANSSAFSYFNIDCSFASSFFCRSMTPRMILLSSSVRWLRSGISGMAPAAEAAAGPGPPRGPCGADIFYTQWLQKREKSTMNQQHSGRYFMLHFMLSKFKLAVGFAGGTVAHRRRDMLVGTICAA